jgi:arsenate reductase
MIMAYILIHHTGCGTSRKGLALLEDKGIDVEIRKYMTAGGRLSVEELKSLAQQMGGVSPRAFMREKDARLLNISEDLDDEALFAAMADNPKLIQRPIGVHRAKATLGRPIERLLDIV